MRIRNAAVFALLLTLCQLPSAFAASRGYFSQLGYTFTKGVKNVLTSPWEIPHTIGQHDKQNDGNPRAIRDTAGLFDGFFRMVTRFGSGAWDMAWSFVPGDQENLTLEPETFF